MARSHRTPAYYICSGADPGTGKRVTSGRLRAAARDACRAASRGDEDAPDRHIEGRTRGLAGTRAPDRGWAYFGDGRAVAGRNHPLHARLCRK